jgi:hypothetical protein
MATPKAREDLMRAESKKISNKPCLVCSKPVGISPYNQSPKLDDIAALTLMMQPNDRVLIQP